MSRTVKGSELPHGTVVYWFPNTFVIRTEVQTLDFEIDFIFDPLDGLWATYFARAQWYCAPLLHPQSTLFQTLYKHFEVYIKPKTFRIFDSANISLLKNENPSK